MRERHTFYLNWQYHYKDNYFNDVTDLLYEKHFKFDDFDYYPVL